MYAIAVVATIRGDLERYASLLNKTIIKDYDDLDYFDAVCAKLPNGIPFELKRHYGFEEDIFQLYIPPALDDYKETVNQIFKMLSIEDSQIEFFVDNYEDRFGKIAWSNYLIELEKLRK